MSTKKRGKYNSRQTTILLLYNARDLQKMLKEKNVRFAKSWHYVYKGYVVTGLPEGKKKEKWEKKLILFWCHFYIEEIK